MNKVFEKLVQYTLVQILAMGTVLGLLFYFMAYDNGALIEGQISTLRTEIAAEEVKKKETDATLKEEARIKDAVGVLSQQYQEISRRLPVTLSSIELNRHIDGFARNSGVSIKARKPMANISREIVEEIPVSITLEGSFAELAQFVYLVAISERVTAVHNYTMTPVEKSTRLRFEGTVTGYQLSPDKPQAAQGAAAGRPK